MQFKAAKITIAENRNRWVDICRAAAVLSVVAWHFNNSLAFGYLGVDLFFVISGLLVGSGLIKKFREGKKIVFFEFVIRRGLKIWPSYYVFLIAGSLLTWLIFKGNRPDYILEGGQNLWRYLFFYQNYEGLPFNWPFTHIWSLCVEEHFYLLLPAIIIAVSAFWSKSKKMLIIAVVCLIIAGILFKIIGHTSAPGIATYTTTHKKVDALGWGVLLGVLVVYNEEGLKKINWLPLVTVLGVVTLLGCIILSFYSDNYWFQKVVFSSLIPVCFFAMLLGLYFRKFNGWKPVQIMAYYSYNWYLWHPLMAVIVLKYLGAGVMALVVYLILSLFVAVFFTILVEERFLMIREKLLPRLFGKMGK